MKYSEERREAILRKLLPPENRPVSEVAAEEGISAPTLYAWRKQARAKGRLREVLAPGMQDCGHSPGLRIDAQKFQQCQFFR